MFTTFGEFGHWPLSSAVPTLHDRRLFLITGYHLFHQYGRSRREYTNIATLCIVEASASIYLCASFSHNKQAMKLPRFTSTSSRVPPTRTSSLSGSFAHETLHPLRLNLAIACRPSNVMRHADGDTQQRRVLAGRWMPQCLDTCSAGLGNTDCDQLR